MHWYDTWHMSWMWLWWLIVGGVLVAIVWGVIVALRRPDRAERYDLDQRVSGDHFEQEENLEQVVKKRYAQGEIDRETYLRLIEDLRT